VTRNQPDNMAYQELHWTPEMIQRFWDFEGRHSQRYFSQIHAHAIVAYIRRHLPPPCDVLDYGCGPGHLVAALADAGYSVAGFEISPDSVSEMRRRLEGHPRFRGVVADGADEAQRERNDLVTVIEVVEHLYDPALDALLANVHAALRPGGRIMITTPHAEDLSASHILCPVSGQVFHRRQHVRRWTVDSLSEALRQRGFTIDRAEAVDFGSMVNAAWRSNNWSILRKALAKQVKYWRKPSKIRPHLVALARKAAP